MEKGVKPKDMPTAIERGGGLKKIAATKKSKHPQGEPMSAAADSPGVMRSKPPQEPVFAKVPQESYERLQQESQEVFSAFVKVEFNEHFRVWSRMKQGTRFTLTCTLGEMTGDSTRITVESLQVL